MKGAINRAGKKRGSRKPDAFVQRYDTKAPPVVVESLSEDDKARAFLRMEEAVQRMMALLRAFALELMVWHDVPDAWHHGFGGGGYTTTADACAKALYEDWNSVFAEAMDHSEGKDGMPAAVRLRISIAKSVSLLRSMAQSLSVHHGEYDDIERRHRAGLPRYEACGYTELASECIAPLESQYKAAFAEWQQFGKSAEQRAAA